MSDGLEEDRLNFMVPRYFYKSARETFIRPQPLIVNYKYCCTECDTIIRKNPDKSWSLTGDFHTCKHLRVPHNGPPQWDRESNKFVYPEAELRLATVDRNLIDKLLASGAYVAKGDEAASLFKKL